eukprot:CAMPEP_0113659478 /NCGR_PEP_ID=MMETSP0017_2-20120614/32381_1 /TAXON_ID=2856 /ORGANISM="Cylindrotheca closterium" /LENGTH=1078 /DNA_ID=CAMNT_0000574035 /DNA_START=785 /DNA_END=4021 /DNA_ORIENTATION=- /assembly_acc=CAM_ASM_000147
MRYFGLILSTLISLRIIASAHDLNTSCFPTIGFNPEKHKTVYRLGVLANRGVEAAYKSYNSTFSDYLTETAGKRFDPPITFEMQHVSFQTMYDYTASNEIDFAFVNSAAAECISAQYSTQSLATIVGSRKKDGQRYNTSTFGGLVITRADNDNINRIEDLKDKVIAAISISGFGAGLMQFYEMEKRGLSFINDPAQIVFTGNQNLIVRGVLEGTFDVGFVRTGQIEKSKDPDGVKVDPSLLKIIEARRDEEDGIPFPFEHTTPLYPEWNIASTRDTPEDVSREVQAALLALAEHGRTGRAIEACLLSNATEQCSDIHALDPSARCDASAEAAMAASQALADGGYSRWRIALSMNKVRNVLQETNFIQNDPELNLWRCNPPSNLYNQISCPDGTNKVSEAEFDQTCAQTGLECPDGFECFCRPCIGETTCHRAAYFIAGRCFSIWLIIAAIFIPVCLVGSIAIYSYLKRKEEEANRLWLVESSELHFPSPLVVVGHGSFGFVLQAEFRGSNVAVKRAYQSRLASKKSSHFKKGEPSQEKAPSAAPESIPGPDVELGLSTSKGATETESSDGMDEEEVCIDASIVQSAKLRTLTASVENRFIDSSDRTWPTAPKSSSSFKKNLSWTRSDFIEEMKTLTHLRHPNIITIMGAVIEKGSVPQLIMEFMEHGSLAEVLQNPTIALESELILRILQDIAQGVRFLHSCDPQVIHGDLKSGNVLIDSTFRAKLSDFGFSGRKPSNASGTPLWMAPELLTGKSLNTTKSDMYAVGIIISEVVSREEPYHDETENTAELLHKIADRKEHKRPRLHINCPVKLRKLIQFLWHHDPDQRPTASALDNRLKELDAHVLDKCSFSANLLRRSNKMIDPNDEVDFLYQAFPRHVADVLRVGGKVEPESHNCVTILFSDIVGFTTIASKVEPIKVSQLLDRLYLKFDKLTQKHDLFKIETIGDAYMCAGNLAKDQSSDHVKRVALFANDAIQAASETLIDEEDPSMGYVHIRAGFHSGPVVSSVVGSLNPRYGLFGDTVNVASRMESNSDGGKVLCTKESAMLLVSQGSDVLVRLRGETPIKGRGKMTTYWVG